MDLPLLKPSRFLLYAFGVSAALTTAGCLFDDALVELDPATLLDDGSLDTLDVSQNVRVPRQHVLESFGAYACPSCPDAEERLATYMHAAPGSAAYSPDLIVVNYHVAFPGTLTDPWITPATQARHDQFGFTSLPQVKLNGSNAPYGIREKDVRYLQGEYDSLIRRRTRVDSLTWLDLRIDTSHYDSATQRLTATFTVLNRASAARGALTFRVVAVKNKSVTVFVAPNHPWETIVTETTDRDSAGAMLSVPGLPGLRSKTFTVSLTIPPETTRTPTPAVLENPADYALVVFARNSQGLIENAATRGYDPQ
jgi:hypothetical protein